MSYTLSELEGKISNYSKNPLKLPKSKHIIVNLSEKLNYVDICVLSNIMIGLTGPHKHSAKEDKPFRINKLKEHIKDLANDPNARVFLGGDLFYFPGGSAEYRELYEPNYENQVELMAELLEPIKDKIIAAYDGTEEIKIFEKDGVNLTKKLMEKLGKPLNYVGQMVEVDFVFKNSYTNNYPKTVNMLFDHGFLAANVTNTVAKKTSGLQNKINGKDFYFSSHYNKLFIEKSAHAVSETSSKLVKKPCYYVSVGGYRDYPNRLTSNRNTAPANTNNGVIRVFVAPNPDRHNIRGNDYFGEPQYKVCQEFINFGSLTNKHIDYDLSKDVSKIVQENILNKEALIEAIKEKIDTLSKNEVSEILEEAISQKQEKRKVNKKTNTYDSVVIKEN